jgi:hypothetical protein
VGALVVALALVCGAAAAAVVRSRPHVYSAQAVLLIDQPQAIAAAPDDGILSKLSALRAKYVALARTPAVIGAAAADAGIPQPVMAQEGSAGASAGNPLVMYTQGSAGSPSEAERVADAMASAVGAFASQEQATDGVAPGGRFEIRELDPATFAVKTAPTTQRIIGVGLAVFLVALGLGYVALGLLPGRTRAG